MKDITGNIEGRWWINGPDSEPVAGVLEHSNKTLKLLVTILNPTSSEADFIRGLVQQNDGFPKVIIGADEHNHPVTLFGCICINTSSSVGQRRYEFSALTGVKGMALESWTQPALKAVMFNVRHLSRWVWKRAVNNIKTEAGGNTFSAVALNRSYYREAGFLFLVQALEVYHTCSGKFNSFELSKEKNDMLVDKVAYFTCLRAIRTASHKVM